MASSAALQHHQPQATANSAAAKAVIETELDGAHCGGLKNAPQFPASPHWVPATSALAQSRAPASQRPPAGSTSGLATVYGGPDIPPSGLAGSYTPASTIRMLLGAGEGIVFSGAAL